MNCSPHQAPSVKSVGITGQLTGSRADLMVLDDIEVPSNSMTELMREKLLQLVTESESILTPKNDSRILFLGTPQTTFTIYRKLAERNYRPFVWTARYPRDTANYEGLLAPQLQEDIEKSKKERRSRQKDKNQKVKTSLYKDNNDYDLSGEPTDPDRFDSTDLLEREASMGRSNFMLQFMLDTSLSDAEKFPLKNADLVITSVNPTNAPESVIWCSDPANVIKDLPTVGLPGDYFYSPMQLQGDWAPYTESICSVDPSGRGSDETAACYISQRNGFLYLHEVFASKDGYSDNTLLSILRRCKKYGVTKLLVETNFGDGLVGELFKKHLQQTKQNIDVEEVRANVRKEDRIIDALEPVLNQHRLIVDRSVIDWDFKSNPDAPPEERLLYMLFYQMSRMCREKGAIKHDDRVDCLAQGVKYFTDVMAISANEQMKLNKQEDWKDMMDEWLDDPEAAANHMVFNMDIHQRRQSRQLKGKTSVHTWV